MTDWCRKFVLLLALTVVPLQGMAATLSIVFCHDDAQAHVMQSQGNHDHDTSIPSQHEHDDSGSTGDGAKHLCCHHVVSGAPLTTPQRAAVSDLPALPSAPQPLHDLFVPERPQRPPLV